MSNNTEETKFGCCPTNAVEIVMSHTEGIDGIFRRTAVRVDGIRWQHLLYPLSVISSVLYERDEKLWLHVSLAHQKRLPSYDEIKMVKERFIGKGKYAVMVFPPEDMFVNINPFCLHLWHCIDGHPLPEFSGTLPSGKRTI